MPFTNTYNLPAALVRALSSDGYDRGEKDFDISVTQLIAAPRKVELKRRHAEKIVEDVSIRVWSLLGNSLHYVLEKSESEESISEQRFYMEIGGWIISGQTDLYEIDGTVSDMKVTSVFSFLLGEKAEHEAQLNLNAMLFRNEGFPVHKVQIMAILRDWMGSRAKFDQAYPQTATYLKEYPLWSPTKAKVYAENRVELHKAARGLPDNELPHCTDEERWYRGEAFAVMGEDAKKATPGGVFDVEEHKDQAKPKAEAMAAEMTAKNTNPKTGTVKKRYIVSHRPGLPNFCLNFCPVNNICNQHKKWLQENPLALESNTEDSQ